MRKITVFWLLAMYCAITQAQVSSDSLIQFSGLVMTSDSLRAIPLANIYVLSTGRGTVSNYNGFFSFVAEPGDTVTFSALGYKKEHYVIPGDLHEDIYSVIELLTRDTIYLSETFIYPWPTKEAFRQAFLAQEIPDDYYELARKNLEREKMKELGEQMGMDATENGEFLTQRLGEKIYYAGEYPPMRIFDVFAWKEFFEAWKRGDFKKKDEE